MGSVGPAPGRLGGPELLIGGNTSAATRRVGRWADGIILPGTPESVSESYKVAEESWKAEGRAGKPRLVGAAYYALGNDIGEGGAAYIRDYYAFLGPAVEYMTQAILTTSEAIETAIQGFSGIGMDELILWPTVPDLDQVDRLAEILA